MYTIQLCRLSGRLRRQASSHIWIAARQLDQRRLQGRHGSKLPRHRSSVAPKLCRYLWLSQASSHIDRIPILPLQRGAGVADEQVLKVCQGVPDAASESTETLELTGVQINGLGQLCTALPGRFSDQIFRVFQRLNLEGVPTVESIRYKDLLINFTSNFTYYGNNRTGESGHFGDAAFTLYRPRVTPALAEYSILGDVLEPNFTDIHGLKVVPIVADAQGSTGTALKPPTGFTWVWEIQRAELTLSIWRPQPPPGYVCMGLVCSNSLRAPDIGTVKCIRADLVTEARINQEVWNDRGTHAGTNFSAWSISPPSPMPAEVFFSTGTFIGHDHYQAPSPVTPTYALRTHLSIEPPTEPSHAPVLHNYAHPTALTSDTATYTTLLPWFVISDPDLTQDQQFLQSPQYKLETTETYKLVRHAYNNTGDIQRYSLMFQSSTSTSTTQTETDIKTAEALAEATFAGYFKTSVKVGSSISQSNAITQGWTTTKSSTVWCTLGAYKAVAVYLISYTYRLLRADKQEVGKSLTRQPNNSLYWTEYPPAPKSVTISTTAEPQDPAFLLHE